ncbi:hypothetical protein TWF173_005842 [Orbilia oligospora]|nr:hypothetical protein TWF173_005842 [Orbilia oligospora]
MGARGKRSAHDQMAEENENEATQVGAEYLGLQTAIRSRDNLAKDPYFQSVQVESSKAPARAPMASWQLWGRRDLSENPAIPPGTKYAIEFYGGNATRQPAYSPILPELLGEDGMPVDKPRPSSLVRLIGLEPRNPYILREYPAMHLKRFSEMYNVHNIKPVAFNVCDESVHIATDGKEYYIVFLDLESAVVPVGDSWDGALEIFKDIDVLLPDVVRIESIGGVYHPLDEEEQEEFFPSKKPRTKESEAYQQELLRRLLELTED